MFKHMPTIEKTTSRLAKVRPWGNSFGIGISKEVLKKLRVGPGAAFKLKVEPNRLVLDLARDPKSFPTLAEIVASYNPKDPPEYVDWGAPVGKEIW